MNTIRQTIARLLGRQSMSANQIADALLLTPADVEHHLEHLARSLKGKLKTQPARCSDCGFIFKNRKRLDAPGRCPSCKSQRIAGPWFRIV